MCTILTVVTEFKLAITWKQGSSSDGAGGGKLSVTVIHPERPKLTVGLIDVYHKPFRRDITCITDETASVRWNRSACYQCGSMDPCCPTVEQQCSILWNRRHVTIALRSDPNMRQSRSRMRRTFPPVLVCSFESMSSTRVSRSAATMNHCILLR